MSPDPSGTLLANVRTRTAMHRFQLLVAATAVMSILPAALPAAADDSDTNEVAVTVTGGQLQISVESGRSNIGTVGTDRDETKISGRLGEVTVRDNRNASASSGWVVTVTATELKQRNGPAIASRNTRYTTGPLEKRGTVSARASGPVDLDRPRPVVTATDVSGNNEVRWTPTITISVPDGATAGTYTQTITYSVL